MKKFLASALAAGALVAGTVAVAPVASAAATPGTTYGYVYSYNCGFTSGVAANACAVYIKQSNGVVQKTEPKRTTPITRCSPYGIPESSPVIAPGNLQTLKATKAPVAIEWEYSIPLNNYQGRVVCLTGPGH